MTTIPARPLLVPCSSHAGGRPADVVLVCSSPPYGDEHHTRSPRPTTTNPTPARPGTSTTNTPENTR